MHANDDAAEAECCHGMVDNSAAKLAVISQDGYNLSCQYDSSV